MTLPAFQLATPPGLQVDQILKRNLVSYTVLVYEHEVAVGHSSTPLKEPLGTGHFYRPYLRAAHISDWVSYTR